MNYRTLAKRASALLFLIVAVLITHSVISGLPHNLNAVYGYTEGNLESAVTVHITAGSEIRSEPIRTAYESTAFAGTPAGIAGHGYGTRGMKTSFGVLPSGSEFEVREIRRCATLDPVNGPYYGFALDDLGADKLAQVSNLTNPGTERLVVRLFSGVEKDPDRWIWVAESNIKNIEEVKNLFAIHE